MRCAVIGDMHGNFHALEAVLGAIKNDGVDSMVCIGDVVGYASNPRECLQAVREQASCVVAGNHDFASADKLDMSYFNPKARDSIEWTKEQLSEEEVAYLAGLPLVAEFEGLFLVHSTPYRPEEFLYVEFPYDVALAFSSMEKQFAFVGHSHVPIVFVNSKPIEYVPQAEFELPDSEEVIVNVGSVGQPRDLDPRASYALLDTDLRRVFIRRVEYDVSAAADAILAQGLPAANAHRLFVGC